MAMMVTDKNNCADWRVCGTPIYAGVYQRSGNGCPQVYCKNWSSLSFWHLVNTQFNIKLPAIPNTMLHLRNQQKEQSVHSSRKDWKIPSLEHIKLKHAKEINDVFSSN